MIKAVLPDAKDAALVCAQQQTAAGELQNALPRQAILRAVEADAVTADVRQDAEAAEHVHVLLREAAADQQIVRVEAAAVAEGEPADPGEARDRDAPERVVPPIVPRQSAADAVAQQAQEDHV